MKRMMTAAAAVALLLPGVAQAQRMTVQTFLNKVDALKKKGMMAMFSSDVSLIKSEVKIATTQLQAEKKAREAAGKPPLACPPQPDGKNKMGSQEFMAALQAIPPAQRGMSLKDGMTRVFITKYPCRKG